MSQKKSQKTTAIARNSDIDRTDCLASVQPPASAPIMISPTGH
jgi:hypothetical protein